MHKKRVCLFDALIWLMTMKIRLKMRHRSQRYKIKRPRLRYEHK